MTVTSADLLNQALQLVGGYNNKGPITGSPPTFDGSQIGLAAGIIYNATVQTVGREFGWDFSRNIADLSVTGNTPPMGWLFEYIYPTNGIQLRQLLPPDADIDPLDPKPVRWTVGNALGGSTAASGSVFFPANPVNGATVTLNGRVFTFVTAGGWPSVQTNYQINIAGSAGGTIFFLVQALTSGTTYLADSAINVADYAETGGSSTDTLTIDYILPGTAGNAYTLAASAATPSGATLTGGATSQQKVIWTNQADAQGLMTNQPPESTWDALFTEAFVRLLASKLAAGIAGKPETAKMELGNSAAFEGIGEKRGDT